MPSRSRRPEVARHRAGDLGEVGLEHAVAGVLEAVREVAVVGEDEQALGVGVEPADVEEPLLAVADEVADVDPAELVAHRGDDAERLVEGEVDPRLVELDAHAVDVHGLGGADAHAELGDDLAVDLHPALADQVLADPARADAGRREQLLQAHAVGVVHVDRRAAGPLRRGRRLAGLGVARACRAAACPGRGLPPLPSFPGRLPGGRLLPTGRGSRLLGRRHPRPPSAISSSTSTSGR